MNWVRVALLTLSAYNVGAHDWDGLIGCAAVWVSIEGAVGIDRWLTARNRRAARARRRARPGPA